MRPQRLRWGRARLARAWQLWRRHEGWWCLGAFVGWLAVLWGVVWLAERAGMY